MASPAVFEILAFKRIGVTTWPFRVTWHHRSRDHSTRHKPFPIQIFISLANVTQWLLWS